MKKIFFIAVIALGSTVVSCSSDAVVSPSSDESGVVPIKEIYKVMVVDTSSIGGQSGTPPPPPPKV